MKLSQINLNSTKSNDTKQFEFMESRDLESLHKFSKLFNGNSSSTNDMPSDRCPYSGITSGQTVLQNNKIQYHTHKIQEIGDFYQGFSHKVEEEEHDLRIKDSGNYIEGNADSEVHKKLQNIKRSKKQSLNSSFTNTNAQKKKKNMTRKASSPKLLVSNKEKKSNIGSLIQGSSGYGQYVNFSEQHSVVHSASKSKNKGAQRKTNKIIRNV